MTEINDGNRTRIPRRPAPVPTLAARERAPAYRNERCTVAAVLQTLAVLVVALTVALYSVFATARKVFADPPGTPLSEST